MDDRDGLVSSLTDLLALVRRNLELDLRVCAPCSVVAYDSATQRATVMLAALPVAYVEGVETPQPPVVIPEVPVEWLGGSLGYVTTPLMPGDTGRVTFTDRALAQWLRTGVPSDPLNGRTHNLGDAIFTPGARHNLNPIVPPTSLTNTVVEGPLVSLGVAALSPAVLGTEITAALTTLAGVYASTGSAIATAYSAWAAIDPPTAVGNGAFLDVIGAQEAIRTTAWATFIALAATWLSTKVLVQ